MIADPVGDRIARCGQLGVEVDDGLDGDLGAGVGAPGLELVEEDEALAFLEASGGPEHRLPTVGVAAKWAWSTTSRAAGSRPVPAPQSGPGEEVEGGLGAGEVTEGLGPPGVERLGRAEGLLQLRHRGRGLGRGRGRRQGRCRPRRAGSRRSGRRRCAMVGVTRVDREVPVLGISSRIGRGELEPLDGLGDEPVELRGADPSRPRRRPGSRSTAAASAVRAGDVWMVASATSRARHGGTPPGLHLRPEPGEAVAELEGVTDELLRRGRGDARGRRRARRRRTPRPAGSPGPAMGSSCSQPPMVNDAAEWIDSGGWRSAQRAATSRRSGRPRSSVALRPRGASASRAGGGEVVASACRPSLRAVSIMCSILAGGHRQSAATANGHLWRGSR